MTHTSCCFGGLFRFCHPEVPCSSPPQSTPLPLSLPLNHILGRPSASLSAHMGQQACRLWAPPSSTHQLAIEGLGVWVWAGPWWCKWLAFEVPGALAHWPHHDRNSSPCPGSGLQRLMHSGSQCLAPARSRVPEPRGGVGGRLRGGGCLLRRGQEVVERHPDSPPVCARSVRPVPRWGLPTWRFAKPPSTERPCINLEMMIWPFSR